MKCPTWKERLAAMDHSHGTSNKMIQEAMLAEITDLRAVERACGKKIQTMTKGVDRYERRTGTLIEQLERRVAHLKGKS